MRVISPRIYRWARGNGLILAEAAVFALSDLMPRAKAEEVVKKACMSAAAENRSLMEVVEQLTRDSAGNNTIDWRALADPGRYLGACEEIIDHVLRSARAL